MQRPVLTFNRRLGVVSYRHGYTVYNARIADSSELVDEMHSKVFKTTLEWIRYLQRIYNVPTSVVPVTLTAHEFIKRMEETQPSRFLISPFQDDKWIIQPNTIADDDDDDDDDDSPRIFRRRSSGSDESLEDH
jgi:hypothetical protein